MVPAGQNAIINTNTGNVATILQDLAATPVDIFVGTGVGSTGLLNHTAGLASTGNNNWMFVGVEGGTGVYNLAKTDSAGGTLTGFGVGEGSMTVGNTGNGGRLYIGGDDNGGGGTGTVNVNTKGTLVMRNDLIIGASGGTGLINVDAGTITTGGWNYFGTNQGGTGGSGTLKMSGGMLTNTGRTYVAQTGTTGKIELTGTGKYLNVNNEQFIVGDGAGAIGEIVVNGANAELRSEGELWIGQGAGGTGSMTVSAGTASVGNWFAIGRDGASGVLTINGTGLVQKTDNDGSLEITNANSPTASGIVNLDGGTLRVNNITGSGGAGSVSNLFLNGGTLKPTVNNNNFIGGTVNPIVRNGGAIIDTDGFDITISKALTADVGSTGGLIKRGVGTLSLTQASNYTGSTVVSGGRLLLSGDASLDNSSGIQVNGAGATLVQNSTLMLTPLVTVANGTLDGTGIIDRVTVTDGGTLTNGVPRTGVLMLNSLSFSGAGTLNLQTSDDESVSINTGIFNAGGLVTLNVSNRDNLWTTGTYDLVGYTTFTGNTANLQKGTIAGLGARQNAAITNGGGIIGLAITGDLPVWTGAQNGNWTTSPIGGAFNWKLQSTGAPTEFITGDTVLFDDSATGTTNVNIAQNVSPTSTTFSNSGKNYTLTSSGGFGIAAGLLTKSGTGSLTITTANTYAGGTTLNAGTLNVNNSSALGTGALTINGGTINNTSGGAITLSTNNSVRLVNDLTFTGTNALNFGTGAGTIGSGAAAQTLNLVNESTLPGTSLTFGGLMSGTGSGALTLNVSGPGNTAFTGGLATGTATSLVVNSNQPGTLTISGPASSVTTLNVNGGATSIVDVGAGNLSLSNGGGSILQSTTGGVINGTGGGSIILASGNGDFGTAGGTTLTVNANIAGTNAVDFYNANGGPGLGTIVLAAANTFTGTTNVENTRLVLPTGGSINGANTPNVGQIRIGTVGNSPAVLDVNGGVINANNGGTNVNVGIAGGANAALNVTSGSVNAAGEVWVGAGAGSFGSLKMTGGTVSGGAWFVIGRNSNATADLSGGTLNVTNRNFITASRDVRGVTNLTGNATLNVLGTGAGNGSVLVGEAFEVSPSVGELNVSGSAALNVAGGDGVFLGVNAGGVGTVNFNGGVVTASVVKKGGGSGFANFDGGTLKANASNSTFMQLLDSAVINDGGAIIDDGGFAIDINQDLKAPTGNGVRSVEYTGGTGFVATPIVDIQGDGVGATGVANIDAAGNLTSITITNPGVGYTSATAALIGGGGTAELAAAATLAPNVSGGFIKRGDGVTTLSGINTYTGATVVEAGTLAISGSISGTTSITAKAGSTFDVTLLQQGLTLGANQLLGGGGTVVGDVTMSTGARLAPGDGAGTLTMNGDLSLISAVTPANSGALQFELGSLALSDKVAFGDNTLSIGTGVLGFGDFTFTRLAGLQSGTYTLFDGNIGIVGSLDNGSLSGSLGGGFTGTLGLAGNNTDIVLTVVPEPASALLLFGGMSGLIGFRRFRKSAV